jgi:ABC-type multidrug transport system fused ATPase/permease subunit
VENKFQSLERVHNKLEEMKVESSNKAKTINLSYNGPLLEFSNVSMRYPGSRITILQSISFQVYPKQRVGIIGRYIIII